MSACIRPRNEQAVDTSLNCLPVFQRVLDVHERAHAGGMHQAAVPWISSPCAKPSCRGCGAWRNTFEQTISRSTKVRTRIRKQNKNKQRCATTDESASETFK